MMSARGITTKKSGTVEYWGGTKKEYLWTEADKIISRYGKEAWDKIEKDIKRRKLDQRFMDNQPTGGDAIWSTARGYDDYEFWVNPVFVDLEGLISDLSEGYNVITSRHESNWSSNVAPTDYVVHVKLTKKEGKK